jgi:negative regulator of flagellin synthesis FlgM
MKIDGNIRSIQSASVSESPPQGAKAGTAAKTQGAGSGGPSVELSSLGSQLAGIEKSLAGVPVVDIQRIEEIKAAITEGRFKVNPDVIADKLLETVQELIRAQKG